MDWFNYSVRHLSEYSIGPVWPLGKSRQSMAAITITTCRGGSRGNVRAGNFLRGSKNEMRRMIDRQPDTNRARRIPTWINGCGAAQGEISQIFGFIPISTSRRFSRWEPTPPLVGFVRANQSRGIKIIPGPLLFVTKLPHAFITNVIDLPFFVVRLRAESRVPLLFLKPEVFLN